MAIGGATSLAAALAGMNPVEHVYPAILWALVVWTLAHTGAAVIMQLYCVAGITFGKLTPRYDADLWNTTLFWHFILITGLVTSAMLGLFPRLLG